MAAFFGGRTSARQFCNTLHLSSGQEATYFLMLMVFLVFLGKDIPSIMGESPVKLRWKLPLIARICTGFDIDSNHRSKAEAFIVLYYLTNFLLRLQVKRDGLHHSWGDLPVDHLFQGAQLGQRAEGDVGIPLPFPCQ
jgi:hypothetical protein